MANDLYTADDIKNLALKQSGELIDGTSDYDILSDESNGIKDLELINSLYKKLHYGGQELNVAISERFDWLKAEDDEILTVIPPYETGTISLTQDSASATLSNAPGAGLGSLKGHYLKVDSIDTIYRISAHTAANTAITLDQIYLEDTNATASFKIIKLDYALTNSMARIYESLRTQKGQFDEDDVGEITYIGDDAFFKLFPLKRLISGTPTRFTIIKNLEDIITIRFNRYPASDKLRVEIPYIPAPEELIVTEFVDSDVNTSTEKITLGEHGLQLNQRVRLTTTGTLPTGLNLDTTYYVIRSDKDDIQLSATKDGSAIDITAASGGGTHTLASVPKMQHGYRTLLSDYATYRIMLDKSDPRADQYLRLGQGQLQAMVNEARRSARNKSKHRGRLVPRMDDVPHAGRARFNDELI